MPGKRTWWTLAIATVIIGPFAYDYARVYAYCKENYIYPEPLELDVDSVFFNREGICIDGCASYLVTGNWKYYEVIQGNKNEMNFGSLYKFYIGDKTEYSCASNFDMIKFDKFLKKETKEIDTYIARNLGSDKCLSIVNISKITSEYEFKYYYIMQNNSNIERNRSVYELKGSSNEIISKYIKLSIRFGYPRSFLMDYNSMRCSEVLDAPVPTEPLLEVWFGHA